MIDNITLRRIELLHPKLREETKKIYLNQIVPSLTGKAMCRFAYTLRTFTEQNALYSQGRTKLFDINGNRLGIVTKAKAGQSFHNYGLAIDIVLIQGKHASWDTVKDFDGDGIADWMEVIDIFRNNGWTWGGNFKGVKDTPHVEKTFGLTWQDCLEIRNSGKIDSEGYIII